jgi:hypothetical protein
MGQRHSAPPRQERGLPHSATTDPVMYSPTPVNPSGDGFGRPTIGKLRLDCGDIDPAALMLNGALLEEIRGGLPPPQQRHWKLLYSSRLHGKSFAQLVRRVRKCGPTVIVVHEAKTEFGDAGRVFGGYTNADWRTNADREHDAKANAAARNRSERCEATGGGPGEYFTVRPDRQARQFFGDGQCFVFTSGPLKSDAASFAESYDPETVRIYRSREHLAAANNNFMYLMDTHPQPDRIGLGMGSDKEDGIGEFAWFVDRYLSKGHCSIRLCPTFGNPRLSAATDFTVQEVEVYGVDGDALAERDADEDDTRALAERHAVDKALLELNGTHFYSDENREGEC